MKIYIDEIPEEGLHVTEELDPREISLDSDGRCVHFIDMINIKAKVAKSGKEVFADIVLQAPVEYTCTRCLSRFQDIFRKGFNVSCEAKRGGILEVDEDIRQEIILDYPMKVVCKPDCKGLCPNCGQNLNITECECKGG